MTAPKQFPMVIVESGSKIRKISATSSPDSFSEQVWEDAKATKVLGNASRSSMIIDTGFLPSTLLSYRSCAGHEQYVIATPPGNYQVEIGATEHDPAAEVFYVSQPWKIIIGDFSPGGVFLGARLFYSPEYPYTDQIPLYHANVPNLNCYGYHATSVGWICLYHTHNTSKMTIAEKASYVTQRVTSGEPFNTGNMPGTDGQKMYRLNKPSSKIHTGRLWEEQTKKHKKDPSWICDPKLLIPILVEGKDSQQCHYDKGVPLTLEFAMKGNYHAYYRDSAQPKPFNDPNFDPMKNYLTSFGSGITANKVSKVANPFAQSEVVHPKVPSGLLKQKLDTALPQIKEIKKGIDSTLLDNLSSYSNAYELTFCDCCLNLFPNPLDPNYIKYSCNECHHYHNYGNKIQTLVELNDDSSVNNNKYGYLTEKLVKNANQLNPNAIIDLSPLKTDYENYLHIIRYSNMLYHFCNKCYPVLFSKCYNCNQPFVSPSATNISILDNNLKSYISRVSEYNHESSPSQFYVTKHIELCDYCYQSQTAFCCVPSCKALIIKDQSHNLVSPINEQFMYYCCDHNGPNVCPSCETPASNYYHSDISEEDTDHQQDKSNQQENLIHFRAFNLDPSDSFKVYPHSQVCYCTSCEDDLAARLKQIYNISLLSVCCSHCNMPSSFEDIILPSTQESNDSFAIPNNIWSDHTKSSERWNVYNSKIDNEMVPSLGTLHSGCLRYKKVDSSNQYSYICKICLGYLYVCGSCYQVKDLNTIATRINDIPYCTNCVGPCETCETLRPNDDLDSWTSPDGTLVTCCKFCIALHTNDHSIFFS